MHGAARSLKVLQMRNFIVGGGMTFAPAYSDLDLDEAQLRAYFSLMDVAALLGLRIEQQLREASDLTYAQFKVLARLGLDSPTGTLRMTELADEVVYSRSGLTY